MIFVLYLLKSGLFLSLSLVDLMKSIYQFVCITESCSIDDAIIYKMFDYSIIY